MSVTLNEEIFSKKEKEKTISRSLKSPSNLLSTLPSVSLSLFLSNCICFFLSNISVHLHLSIFLSIECLSLFAPIYFSFSRVSSIWFFICVYHLSFSVSLFIYFICVFSCLIKPPYLCLYLIPSVHFSTLTF